ncbi:putative RNA-directed DNA polymerase, eukaryota, reverse transcriptase zinc-binding domain protein [Tanacetum coccineum]
MLQVDRWMIRQVWGNTHFNFVASSARGLSGGILCIWNSLVFIKHKILCNDYYVVVDGLWIPGDVQIRWIVVYAPQNLASKIALWSSLSNLTANWDGILVVMGDFHEVRNGSKRYGSIFNEKQADLFNEFISDTSLVDIPLGGYNYTWTNKWGSKMSKLDRFLVSDSFYDKFPHTTSVILEKGTPDHRPILLKEFVVDYGTTPFRFFHSWLEMDGFHDLVINKWSNDGIVDSNEHQARISSIDAKVDQGCASEEDFINRKDSLKILGELDHLETKDLAQKAKLKWALEGDENSEADMFNPLSSSQRESLDQNITREEIKRAVWDCGGDRAPGPNGFVFKFFKTFWDLIEGDVVRFVLDFFRTNSFPKGCNSSFIALIPKVHNAKLVSDFRPISLIGCQYKIIGKILANRLCGAWYQERNKKLMVFKVDFEKAFDSLRWDFLDLVMEKLGFGLKWRSWIQGCLRNNRSSILVNGSPVTFLIFMSLYDTINDHYLFLSDTRLLCLHAFTRKADALGLIKGACIGRDNMSISHLMYADDVAIGVSDDEISCMANVIGCGVAKFPLKYIGVPIGCNMNRKIGNGASTYFGNDTWCGDLPFKIQYPRVYALYTDKNCLIANRISLIDWSDILRRNLRGGAEQSQFDAILSAIENVTLSDKSDSWQWLVNGCNGFSVTSARSLIDSFFLDGDTIATRWNRFIPIKVNVFLWRLNLNKLPTRVNLDRKGIDIGSVLWPTCQGDVETVNHTFFNCALAKDLWILMAKWWELDISIFANIFEWYAWLDSLHFFSVTRMFIEGVGGILLWFIWSFRNRMLFSSSPLRRR